jgi:dTDP-4-dehydrorhamnose 3,5-epimerase
MKFNPLPLSGVYLIEINPHNDHRGFFARSFCKQEFEKNGLHNDFVQCNISYSEHKGTLRGLHYQLSPLEEVKVVTCLKGTIYDVVVDIRQNSSTYGQWLAVELSDKNHHALYVPKGFAHGFQTLCDNAEVFYYMGHFYNQEAAAGIRWNCPKLKINWPDSNPILSERDKNASGLL